MNQEEKEFDKIKLSSEVTIGKYRELLRKKDREEIADFIRERFTERYIDPVKEYSSRNGFCIMAVCCLMIETLESFYRGMENSTGNSEALFCNFFDRWSESHFSDFRGHANEFYKHIRCGILHQAETTNGWRIHRQEDEPLLNYHEKIINADKFRDELEKTLNDYCRKLKDAEWDSDIWKQFQKKMKNIIKNCQSTQ